LASENNKQLIDRWNVLAKEAIDNDEEVATLFNNIKARY
jgi:hypothetical protein